MSWKVVVVHKRSDKVIETIAEGQFEDRAQRIADGVRINFNTAEYRVDVVEETKQPKCPYCEDKFPDECRYC